jgi:hypothetical protein
MRPAASAAPAESGRQFADLGGRNRPFVAEAVHVPLLGEDAPGRRVASGAGKGKPHENATGRAQRANAFFQSQ